MSDEQNEAPAGSSNSVAIVAIVVVGILAGGAFLYDKGVFDAAEPAAERESAERSAPTFKLDAELGGEAGNKASIQTQTPQQ